MKDLLSYNINLRGLQHYVSFLKHPIFLSVLCFSFVLFVIFRFVLYSLISPGEIIFKRDDKGIKISQNWFVVSYIGKFLFSMFLILYFLSANFSFFTSIGIKFDEFKPLEQGVILSQYILNRFHITSTYGMYNKIDGKNGRNELEVLFYDEQHKWQNLEFKYKVSYDVGSPPKRASPHQPRLDWQMNKAAQSKDINSEAWLVILIGKVLEKNPVILDLLGYQVDEKSLYYQCNYNSILINILTIDISFFI